MATLTIVKEYKNELTAPMTRTQLADPLIAGDKWGHYMRVKVYNAGALLDLQAATVTGYFQRADGSTVIVEGGGFQTFVGATLSAACYVIPGRFTFMLRVMLDSVYQTVLWLEGWVQQSRTDELIQVGTVVPSLDALLAKIAACEAAATAANSAAAAANAAAGSATTAAGKLSNLTVAASQQAEVSAALSTVNGHYHLAFGIPKGKDGVVASLGTSMYSLAVNSAGDLILSYPTSTTPPPLSINSSGDLIYTT